MGCDIHLHVEICVRGEWMHYRHPSINRNYRLFSKMAGVRANDTSPDPISEPRGLPANTTPTTRFDCDHWAPDGHSHSWLAGREVMELMEWIATNKEWDTRHHSPAGEWGHLFGGYYDSLFVSPEDLPLGLEDVRFVFWFDN